MSSGEKLYACVDVGTTRIKLNVYDAQLNRKHSETVQSPVSTEGLQDAEQLFQVVKHLLDRGRELGAKSAGLATYRASTVAWDREGRPLTPIVTWTDRRVFDTYRKLPAHIKLFGKIPPFDLVISPFSPVLKFLRLGELNPSLPADCMQWTIDAYLAYRLTGRFVSDATNATLTGIVDPRSMKEFGIVKSIFKLHMQTPELVENAERVGAYGDVELNSLIADQQAASVAGCALTKGTGKVTNGTGTFVDIPTDGFTRRGDLIPLVLLRHRKRNYFGVEGLLPTTGKAADKMLEMGILRDYSDLEVEGDKGVTFIPALAGLQVPRSAGARGVIAGLDLGSDRGAIISGLLKAVAFHVRFVIEQSREEVRTLVAGGALSKSNELMKRIAAATAVSVTRPTDVEATARGLAMLQLVSTGKSSIEELSKVRGEAEVFVAKGDSQQEGEYAKWKKTMRLFRSSKGSSLAE
jgi:glycerol kinase